MLVNEYDNGAWYILDPTMVTFRKPNAGKNEYGNPPTRKG
jgi:hypothetical protein